MTADDPRHGTANGYNNRGCRCPACKAAWAVYHREHMHADPDRVRRHAARMNRARAATSS